MKSDPNNTPATGEDSAEQLVTPFFARFLEIQREGDDPNTTNMTLKYPSDRDEDNDWAV
ncbi:MAG TPA: microviridin/marinostatin family tricyclic proteinase inhibitor [Pyrinomonadaceae bacterium]|nr:microviridin/marinostatin family tricyclic proteinase inhibitor [Pyrinomonadaceae bacterium]